MVATTAVKNLMPIIEANYFLKKNLIDVKIERYLVEEWRLLGMCVKEIWLIGDVIVRQIVNHDIGISECDWGISEPT